MRQDTGQALVSREACTAETMSQHPQPSTLQGLSASTAGTPRCRKNHNLWEVLGPPPTNSRPSGTSQRDRMSK